MSVEVEVIRKTENGRKKGDVCREFVLVNSTVQKIWHKETKIIGAFEQNGSIIKRMRKPEQSVVNEALLSWFNLLKLKNYIMYHQL